MGSPKRSIPIILVVLSLSLSICLGKTKGDARGKNTENLFFNPRVGLEKIRKVVILPIRSEGDALRYASRATDLLVRGFRKVRKYELLSPQELTDLIEEKGIDGAKIHHYALAVEIGKSLGVDGVLMGSLAEYGIMGKRARFGLNLRMIRIPEGDTVWSTSCSTTGKAADIEKIGNEGIGSILQTLVEQWQSSKETIAWGIKLQPLQTSGGYSHISITIPQYREMETKAYLVNRGTSESGPFKEIKRLTMRKKGSLIFRDGDVRADRPYFYRYRVLTKGGFVSPFSEVVEASLGTAPSSPTGLLAIKDKVREIRLTWDKSPDREVAGYRIYRSQYPDRDYRPIGIVKSRNTTRYRDKGDAKNPLGDAVQYFYRITAYYPSKKESQKSEAASATTTGRPSIPKGLMAKGTVIREIPLSWTPNPEPEVKGYNIYRSISKDGPYSLITKVDGGKKNSYMDSKDLADKTEYFYRITAFNTVGVESDPTVPVSATTRGIPLAPQRLRAKGGMVKSVLLEWTPPPDPEVRGYIVYRSSSPEGEFIEAEEIRGGQKDSFLDRGSAEKRLEDGTVYYYRIRSYNKVDVPSEETEIVSARTKRVPQAPRGLKAFGGQARRISLGWNPNPEKDIKHYVFYRSDDSAKKYRKIAVEPEGKTEFIDTKLADGTTYHYKMSAIDRDGLASEFSESISATTKPAPSTPKGIKAEGGRGRVVISWDANPEADIIRYHVYRKTARFNRVGSTEGLSYTDEKVKNGKTYTYAVTAVDRDGLESEFSTEVSATTPPE